MRKEKRGKRGKKKMDERQEKREKESGEVEERIEERTEEGTEEGTQETEERLELTEEACEEEERCEEDLESDSAAKRARVCSTFTDSQRVGILPTTTQQASTYTQAVASSSDVYYTPSPFGFGNPTSVLTVQDEGSRHNLS